MHVLMLVRKQFQTLQANGRIAGWSEYVKFSPEKSMFGVDSG